MEYLERILLREIKKWVGRGEIILIKGPRQDTDNFKSPQESRDFYIDDDLAPAVHKFF